MASISTTSSAAFIDPLTATVATGMPLGICTVESSASRPSEIAARQRHADDGQGRVGGHDAGEVGRHAGAADERRVAVLPSARGQLGDLGRVPVGRQHAHVGLDAEALERLGGRGHLVGVVGRAHQHGDLGHGWQCSSGWVLRWVGGDVGAVVHAGPVDAADAGVGRGSRAASMVGPRCRST